MAPRLPFAHLGLILNVGIFRQAVVFCFDSYQLCIYQTFPLLNKGKKSFRELPAHSLRNSMNPSGLKVRQTRQLRFYHQ